MRTYLKFVLGAGLTIAALSGCGMMLNAANWTLNILGVVLAGFIGAFWIGRFTASGPVKAWRERISAGSKKRALFLVVVVIAAIGSANCATRVNAGMVGIKINYAGTYRGVQDLPIVTGWVVYWPGSSTVFEYPTFVQNVVWTASVGEGNPTDESVSFTNADQMTIAVDISLAYHLDPAKVPAFYVKFRNDDLKGFNDGFMRNVARDQFNAVAGKYHIEQIMGDNGAFIAEVRKNLNDDLGQYGVVIDQFGIIGSPRPPRAILDSINMKVQAQQIAVQKQNELAQATADAAKAVATAQGEASAQIAHAEGEAKANQVLASSVTPTLIEWRRLQIQSDSVARWNGVLPNVTGGALPMLQIPTAGK